MCRIGSLFPRSPANVSRQRAVGSGVRTEGRGRSPGILESSQLFFRLVFPSHPNLGSRQHKVEETSREYRGTRGVPDVPSGTVSWASGPRGTYTGRVRMTGSGVPGSLPPCGPALLRRLRVT